MNKKNIPRLLINKELKLDATILTENNDQHYYWIYYYKNEEVKIIGKSSIKPKCYRQIARYKKWEII